MTKVQDISVKNDDRETILKVRHLRQYFPVRGGNVRAVDDVSFDIKKGEIFGLVGESGCGKTTTGRSIIGLYKATGGYIEFNGKPIYNGKNNVKTVIKDRQRYTKDAKARLATIRDELVIAKPDQKDEIIRKYNAQIEQEDKDLVQFEKDYREFLDSCPEANDVKQEDMARMQMIFQDPISSINPRMTVREIIAEGLIIQGEKNKEVIKEKVYDALEKVGLVRQHANRYPHEFSGGQRQRVGIARAAVMEPDLIIADEPVSALDVSVQAQVLNLLNELREQYNLTILFIAHNLSVVKYFSDRIGVMYYGKIVELCDSDELFAHPLHPYTKSLLSAIPYPDPLYEKHRNRISYNPAVAHDYEFDKPKFQEIRPGHFVLCNEAEKEQMMAELAEAGFTTGTQAEVDSQEA